MRHCQIVIPPASPINDTVYPSIPSRILLCLPLAMICKLLHYHIRKAGGYIDDADFAALVKAQKLDLIVLDFCALFFSC